MKVDDRRPAILFCWLKNTSVHSFDFFMAILRWQWIVAIQTNHSYSFHISTVLLRVYLFKTNGIIIDSNQPLKFPIYFYSLFILCSSGKLLYQKTTALIWLEVYKWHFYKGLLHDYFSQAPNVLCIWYVKVKFSMW